MTINSNRKRLLLLAGVVLAIIITLFFGARLVRRLFNRPTFEPIRSWMDVGYVSRAYGVPPQVIEDALGLAHGPKPVRQTIADIAKAQNRTSDEIIKTIQDAIATARPPRGPPGHQPPNPTGVAP